MRALEERPAALAFRRREEAAALEASREVVGDEDLARRQQQKNAKLLLEASRPLDPWERYRALVDAFEQGIDLAEMADRKVRFALLVMASLNIAVFALTTHSELLGFGPFQLRGWLGAYLLIYAIVAVYFFIQAVDALRPRAGTPPGASPGPSFEASRLRHLERVLSQDVATYAQAWRDVRFDQLHNELALQNHRLAQINEEKYAALGRLYGGLRVLALLLAGLVVFASAYAVLASLLGAR
jgi:hypothetical protein